MGGLVNIRLEVSRLIELGDNVGEWAQLLDVRSEVRQHWKVGRHWELIGKG